MWSKSLALPCAVMYRHDPVPPCIDKLCQPFYTPHYTAGLTFCSETGFLPNNPQSSKTITTFSLNLRGDRGDPKDIGAFDVYSASSWHNDRRHSTARQSSQSEKTNICSSVGMGVQPHQEVPRKIAKRASLDNSHDSMRA